MDRHWWSRQRVSQHVVWCVVWSWSSSHTSHTSTLHRSLDLSTFLQSLQEPLQVDFVNISYHFTTWDGLDGFGLCDFSKICNLDRTSDNKDKDILHSRHAWPQCDGRGLSCDECCTGSPDRSSNHLQFSPSEIGPLCHCTPLGYLQTVTLLLNIISHGLWPWNGSNIWTSSYRMIKKQVNASLNIFSPDTLDTSIQHRQDSSKCIFHTDIQVMKTLFDINSQNGLLICVCWECSWW